MYLLHFWVSALATTTEQRNSSEWSERCTDFGSGLVQPWLSRTSSPVLFLFVWDSVSHWLAGQWASGICLFLYLQSQNSKHVSLHWIRVQFSHLHSENCNDWSPTTGFKCRSLKVESFCNVATCFLLQPPPPKKTWLVFHPVTPPLCSYLISQDISDSCHNLPIIW